MTVLLSANRSRLTCGAALALAGFLTGCATVTPEEIFGALLGNPGPPKEVAYLPDGKRVVVHQVTVLPPAESGFRTFTPMRDIGIYARPWTKIQPGMLLFLGSDEIAARGEGFNLTDQRMLQEFVRQTMAVSALRHPKGMTGAATTPELVAAAERKLEISTAPSPFPLDVSFAMREIQSGARRLHFLGRVICTDPGSRTYYFAMAAIEARQGESLTEAERISTAFLNSLAPRGADAAKAKAEHVLYQADKPWAASLIGTRLDELSGSGGFSSYNSRHNEETMDKLIEQARSLPATVDVHVRFQVTVAPDGALAPAVKEIERRVSQLAPKSDESLKVARMKALPEPNSYEVVIERRFYERAFSLAGTSPSKLRRDIQTAEQGIARGRSEANKWMETLDARLRAAVFRSP